MKTTLKITLAAAVLAAPLQAAPTGFTDFIGFGDSLSDKGRLVPNPAEIPPKAGSRFSDGPTWMEQLGAAFEARGGENINMSLGGATAGPNTPGRIQDYIDGETLRTFFLGPRNPNDPDDIPFPELQDFAAQVTSFLNGPTTSVVGGLAQRVGSNPFVTILLGGNDFLGLPDAPTPAEFNAVSTTVITAISAGITALATADAKFDDFMVSNMPSFVKNPGAFGIDPAAAAANEAATQQFNAALAGNMSVLGTSLGVNIEIFDLYGTFNTVYDQGVLDGLIANDSCLPGGGVNNCPNPGDSANYLFLDDIHPNSFIHSGIGDAALAQVAGRIAAPVPLPAGGVLLLAGLGVFVVNRRRAAA